MVFDEGADELGAVAAVEEVLGVFYGGFVLEPVTALPLVDGFCFVVGRVVTGYEVGQEVQEG